MAILKGTAKLKGVHPDLIAIVSKAIMRSKIDFIVTCGQRTLAEQKILKAKGASQTLRSRHIPGKDGLSKAIDVSPIVDGKVRWDWPLYYPFAALMKQAAKELKIPVEWGGDWKSFKDGPHWQLPWSTYP